MEMCTCRHTPRWHGLLVTEAGIVVGIACGPARRYRRFYAECEVCRRRTAQARRWDGMYYGFTEVCLPCGAEWQDGIALAKPDRVMARRWWNEAMPAREFDAWVREQERSYFDDDEDYEDDWHDSEHPVWIEGCADCVDRADAIEAAQ